jgi:hypothetical protein
VNTLYDFLLLEDVAKRRRNGIFSLVAVVVMKMVRKMRRKGMGRLKCVNWVGAGKMTAVVVGGYKRMLKGQVARQKTTRTNRVLMVHGR